MTRGIIALNTLDVFNTYSVIISERLRSAGTSPLRIYVGDCVNYTFQLFINNGWSPAHNSPDVIYDVLKNVLGLCFQLNGINGTAEWSDDMNYIYVT